MPVEHHASPEPPPLADLDPEVVNMMRSLLRRYVYDIDEPRLLSDDEVDRLIAARKPRLIAERHGNAILAAADAADLLAERLVDDRWSSAWYRKRGDDLRRHAAELGIV